MQDQLAHYQFEPQKKTTYAESVENGGHDVKDLGIPCSGNIAIVVSEYGVHQWRHEVGIDSLKILRFADESLHQLQNLLLDRPELSDLRCLRRNKAYE